jgi:hypothetical protein
MSQWAGRWRMAWRKWKPEWERKTTSSSKIRYVCRGGGEGKGLLENIIHTDI